MIVMAHYAVLNSDNIVISVFPGRDEDDTSHGVNDWESYYSNVHGGMTVLRTSYNTHGGEHRDGGTPFRYNFAGVGFTYDPDRDAFIPPQPFSSWTLDLTTFNWVAPVPYPDDGQSHDWDENALNWTLAPPEPTDTEAP